MTFSNNYFIEFLIFPVEHRFKNENKTSSCHHTMEQVTPGPSCSKKSAALTSSRAVKASEASNLQQGTTFRY